MHGVQLSAVSYVPQRRKLVLPFTPQQAFIEHLLCARHYDPTVNKADRILFFMGLTGCGIRVQEAERELIC